MYCSISKREECSLEWIISVGYDLKNDYRLYSDGDNSTVFLLTENIKRTLWTEKKIYCHSVRTNVKQRNNPKQSKTTEMGSLN